jgi:hypothetical protein
MHPLMLSAGMTSGLCRSKSIGFDQSCTNHFISVLVNPNSDSGSRSLTFAVADGVGKGVIL